MTTAPDGDKRWTAVLSIDMADFTALSQKIGAERMYELLALMVARATDAIETHGGHVVDTAGDGILSAFGAPNALENAPLQSCRAALAFQKKMSDEVHDLRTRFGTVPRFRAGIGGGNTMIARLDGGAIKVVGDPVNKAARLQTLAAPGEIIISETIRREAEGFVSTTDRGEVLIKGFADPIRIHSLDATVEAATRFGGSGRRNLAALVSRQSELAEALDALDPEGSPRLFAVTGPPGIGKSRLTHEIVETLGTGRPVYIGQCAPTGQATTFEPLLGMLRQASGVERDAGLDRIMSTLALRYPDLGTTDEPTSIASGADHFDSTDRALRTRARLLGAIRGLAKHEKCLFVIEDVHWIDSASSMLLASLAMTPVRMLVTSRPEFGADWLETTGTKTIRLAPLDQDGIVRLVETHLGGALAPELVRFLHEKSEGVPLMAEEIARALREAGAITQTEDGISLSTAPPSVLTGNLEQLVLSRVDRLAFSNRAALQTASAIGRDFREDLVTAALGRPSDFARIGTTPGLIEETAPGIWRFDHALIRDAIYGSLLTAQREDLHRRIATAIEGSLPKSGTFAPLAEHWLRSGSPERAAPHLIRAAGESLEAYALHEVDERLERAMTMLETDPGLVDEEMFRRLAVDWLRALHQIGDMGRMRRIADRVMTRLERHGYTPDLGIARTLTAIATAHSRDYTKAREMAMQTLSEAEENADDWGAAWAKVALMRIYEETKWEPPTTVERLAAEIDPVAEATGDRHLAMSAVYLLSAIYRSSGQKRRALEVADRIEAFADSHGDRRARTYAYWARAIVYSAEGNPEAAHAAIGSAHEEAIPGSADERVCAGIELFARSFFTAPDDLRDRIRNLASEARSLRDFNIAHSMDWTLALLELRAGNLAQGWRMLTDFCAEAEDAGNRNFIWQGQVTRIEMLQAISGLVDPAAEAPPDRPVFPRKRPGAADLATYLLLKATATRRLRQELERCLADNLAHSGPHVARCEIGLGLVAAARGDRESARDLLKSGRDRALAENLDILVARADRGLASVGSTSSTEGSG